MAAFLFEKVLRNVARWASLCRKTAGMPALPGLALAHAPIKEGGQNWPPFSFEDVLRKYHPAGLVAMQADETSALPGYRSLMRTLLARRARRRPEMRTRKKPRTNPRLNVGSYCSEAM